MPKRLTFPLRDQALIKWYTLYQMMEDFRKEPNTPIGLTNILLHKMKAIENANPNRESEIKPLLEPYLD